MLQRKPPKKKQPVWLWVLLGVVAVIARDDPSVTLLRDVDRSSMLGAFRDGIENNSGNALLSAIHFVDMPWMINPGHTDFAPYREAAAKLAAGEAQRWFAIGVDAWNILASRAAEKSLLIPGLSGTLHMEGSAIVRELPMAQFRGNGLALESER